MNSNDNIIQLNIECQTEENKKDKVVEMNFKGNMQKIS